MTTEKNAELLTLAGTDTHSSGLSRAITSDATGVALNRDRDVIEAYCIYERARSVSGANANHSARKEAHPLVVSPASNFANRVS